jgi:hypothetical protein
MFSCNAPVFYSIRKEFASPALFFVLIHDLGRFQREIRHNNIMDKYHGGMVPRGNRVTLSDKNTRGMTGNALSMQKNT